MGTAQGQLVRILKDTENRGNGREGMPLLQRYQRLLLSLCGITRPPPLYSLYNPLQRILLNPVNSPQNRSKKVR
jgi:hypothetical protein